MIKIKNILLVALALLTLTACMGRDFIRPTESQLKIGKSTKAEVISLMGEPRDSFTTIQNGEKVETLVYLYSMGAAPGRINLMRNLTVGIHKDVVASKIYVSTMANDNTYFESDRVKDIEKGKTTKNEILTMFGKPNGEYVFPFSNKKEGYSIRYSYGMLRNIVVSFIMDYKQLEVSFDSEDVVTDYSFSSTGI